jgi:hypothetical protein
MSLPKKRTSPDDGSGPVPKNTLDAGADFILAVSRDTHCGRCGGTAGPEGAWCDQCIKECREYTLRLDNQAGGDQA